MTKDPVCGKTVIENRTKFQSEYMGKTYYFCKSQCKEIFDGSPMRYRTESPYRPRTSSCCGPRM